MGFVKDIAPFALGGALGGTAIKKGGLKALASPAAALLSSGKSDQQTGPIESGSLMGDSKKRTKSLI